jgi:hypothetical protein
MSDGYNNRILKLDLDGRIIGSFGSHGKLPGELELPHQMTVDSRGAVYGTWVWRFGMTPPSGKAGVDSTIGGEAGPRAGAAWPAGACPLTAPAAAKMAIVI